MSKSAYREIARSLSRVNDLILRWEEQELKRSRFSDLTITEMHTISVISMYESPTASELAQKLGVAPGTATATINRLCRKGYAERQVDIRDRRVVRIKLTRRGRLIFRIQQAYHDRMANSFLKDIDDQYLGTVQQSLNNLEEFLNDNLSK